ncbi:MAG: hypothetical protein IJ504_01190 [Bacteroidales bacterium]|nr:hypothetical protein [Bacteroidales bacterium]
METENLNGFDFSEMSRRKLQSESDNEMRKSSYLVPLGLQRKMKILAAERGMKLNDLIIESFMDLLRKYGR